MRPAESRESSFNGMLGMFKTRRITEALRRDGAHGRKSILNTVVKFAVNERLQMAGGFPFLRIDTSLCK